MIRCYKCEIRIDHPWCDDGTRYDGPMKDDVWMTTAGTPQIGTPSGTTGPDPAELVERALASAEVKFQLRTRPR